MKVTAPVAARRVGELTIHTKRGHTSDCGIYGPWVLVGSPVTCGTCLQLRGNNLMAQHN